ncbi:MAG TPA: hypothetical protein PKM65_17915 [Spirochaetota bacterium]|nr:hypothetical protein [Spirochaetota bacterium]HNT13069.1 hypothetical protein [Spirochaetota bacterium]
MKILHIAIALASITLAAYSTPALAQYHIDLEGGYVDTGYNDIRIPAKGGTRFSLTQDLEAQPTYFYRGRAGYTFSDRHTVSFLAAPLRVVSLGTLRKDVRFGYIVFREGEYVETTFRFDSYRATYRYDFFTNESWRIGAGFTAKIRDASIKMESADLIAEEKNTGFVPILNFNIEWKFAGPFSLLVNGDALASPYGRAEDVFAGFLYQASKNVIVKLGYRILEGGADNKTVYTFSQFNYAAAGVVILL